MCHRKICTLLFTALAMSAAVFSAGCAFMPPDTTSLLKLDVPSNEEPDLTVHELLTRMHEATDPKNAWRDCKSYIVRQSVRAEERDGLSRVERYYTSEIKYRAGGFLRQTSYLDGKEFKILIVRDGKAWEVDPGKNKAKAYEAGIGMNLFRVFLGMSDPKATYSDIFSSIKLGVVWLDKKRTYRMICRVQDEKIAPYVVYVDATTFLPVKFETVLYTDDDAYYLYRSEPMEFEWRSNVKMAITTRTTVGDRTAEDFVLEEFLINPVIPDSEFDVPSGVVIDYSRVRAD